eukprot:6080769-Prymnesium_polylepis.1
MQQFGLPSLVLAVDPASFCAFLVLRGGWLSRPVTASRSPDPPSRPLRNFVSPAVHSPAPRPLLPVCAQSRPRDDPGVPRPRGLHAGGRQTAPPARRAAGCVPP